MNTVGQYPGQHCIRASIPTTSFSQRGPKPGLHVPQHWGPLHAHNYPQQVNDKRRRLEQYTVYKNIRTTSFYHNNNTHLVKVRGKSWLKETNPEQQFVKGNKQILFCWPNPSTLTSTQVFHSIIAPPHFPLCYQRARVIITFILRLFKHPGHVFICKYNTLLSETWIFFLENCDRCHFCRRFVTLRQIKLFKKTVTLCKI